MTEKKRRSKGIFLALALLLLASFAHANGLALARDYLENNTLEIAPGQSIDYQLRVQNKDAPARSVNITVITGVPGVSVAVNPETLDLEENTLHNPFTITVSASSGALGGEGPVHISVMSIPTESAEGTMVSLKGEVKTKINVKVINVPVAYLGSDIGKEDEVAGDGFFSSVSALIARGADFVKKEPFLVGATFLLVFLLAFARKINNGLKRLTGEKQEEKNIQTQEEEGNDQLQEEKEEIKSSVLQEGPSFSKSRKLSKEEPKKASMQGENKPGKELPDPWMALILFLIVLAPMSYAASSDTGSFTVTITGATLTAPNNAIPVNNTVLYDYTPNISWTAASGGGVGTYTYRLQIAADNAFNTIEVDVSSINTNYYELNSTQTLTRSIHYWRVLGTDGSDNSTWSGWTRFENSEVSSFVPSPPSGGSASGSTTVSTPTTTLPSVEEAPVEAALASEEVATPVVFSILDLGSVDLSELSKIFYDTKMAEFPLYSTTGTKAFTVTDFVNEMGEPAFAFTDPASGRESDVPKIMVPVGVGVGSLVVLAIVGLSGAALWIPVGLLTVLSTMYELGV